MPQSHLSLDTVGRGGARRPAAILAALALFLLSACGPLPRPFQPETKDGNALLVLPDSAGIAVAPPTGDVPHDGTALAAAMAEAMAQQNVPASVASGNGRSRWLLGHAELAGGGDGTARLRLTWELFEPDGAALGRHIQDVDVPAIAWGDGDEAVLAEVARAAAPAIAAMVQAPDVRQSELPGYPPGTRVVMGRIEGGPPDAGRALARAMARQLRNAELPLAERARPGDVVIEGRLELGPPQAGARPIGIVWTLHRQGDATAMGDLRQANAVAQADIDRGWPRLASLIARAAAPGVLRVLEAGAPVR